MSGLVGALRHNARSAARATAFGAAAVVSTMTGFAFLTIALWLVLASGHSPLVAWVVIGLIYLLVGVCFTALARQDHAPAMPAPADPVLPGDPFLRLAEGFAVGLQAGRAARKPPR